MSNVSYGSLTIVDITDLGEFSVYPMSNLPISVVSDPNTSTYTPNWANNNLIIEPVCYYAGSSVTPTSVTYTVQVNSGVAGAISAANGEAKDGNKLKVTSNRFSDASIDMITYYVTATYREPDSGQILTAMGQITYSVIRQLLKNKTCTITGGNVFKYGTTGTISGANTITLTGTVTNVTISKWQYKKADGTWADYPNGTITGGTLTVTNTDAIFNNDVAVIKLTTSDENVYDICQIVNLRDGAAGTSTISAVLTNDSQMIPCDSNGNPTATAFDDAVTTIKVYNGGNDDTSSWTITATPSSGVTGSWNSSTKTYTVTGLTTDAGSVTFNGTKTGQQPIVKQFDLVKVTVGKDGTSPTIYTLEPSTLAMNRDINNAYTPNTVTFRAYSQTGNASRSAYSGRFKIYVNGSSTASYSSSTNESSYTYTPSGGTTSTIKCDLYVAGGGGSPVDTQTIVITSDGQTGATGNGISETVVEYANGGTNGTNSATVTGWQSTIPSVAANNYLWTRTTYKYTDSDDVVSYSVSKTGANGTSVSITSTEIKYVQTSTNTQPGADAGWATTIPETLTPEYYLWTRTIVNYSNGSSTTSYSVAKNGKNGSNGTSTVNVVAGNYSDTIPCTSGGLTTAAYTITIPFRGYQGTSAKYTSATVSGDIYGASTSAKVTPTITNATSSAEGKIVYSLPASALIGSTAATKSGEITITYTVTNGTTSAGSTTLATVTQKYTWVKTNAATNGSNAIILDIYAPNGDIIRNGVNTVTLTARLINGTAVQTSNVSYQWYKYNSLSNNSDKYDSISNASTANLNVEGKDVDGYASFKCVATYSSKTYTAYYSVRDLDDPLQVTVVSSIGDKITNGVGKGYIYPIVRQAGTEIDAMPEIVDNVSKVSSGKTECYLIDHNETAFNDKIKYMKYESGMWKRQTEGRQTSCTYEWTFRDKDGNAVSYCGATSSSSPILYVSGSLIDKKIIFDIKVTKA